MLLFDLALVVPGGAASNGPRETVEETLRAVSAALSANTPAGVAGESQRRERVRGVIVAGFDLPTMAQVALGGHWTGLTGEQQMRFVGLFERLFARSYDRLVLRFLGDRQTTYEATSIADDHAAVQTQLRDPAGEELPVEYKLSFAGGQWRMTDVVIDGVSLAANFRSQFAKMLRASSYDGVVEQLETRVAQQDAG